jgi:tagatose 6-phosphate kinase
MILTVTLNAALDRTLVAPGFATGKSWTVERGLELAGGKGLNVARALKSLGCEALALGFAGGLNGARMRQALSAEGLSHSLTEIVDESRICTAIVDPEIGAATEVNEAGPTISRVEIDAFLAIFHEALPSADLVCLSGSLPLGVPEDFYAHLIHVARRANVACILDSRGAALRIGLGAHRIGRKGERWL